MRIDLDEALATAARDDHDPTRLDAGSILREVSRRSRRTTGRWLAALTALVLAAGLTVWLQARPTTTPPTSTPNASPSAEWSWSGTDPSQDELPAAVVQERCPARPGERVDTQISSRAAGGTMVFRRGSDQRACFLGYQHAPVMGPLTAAEVAGDDRALIDSCGRHSGFDFDDSWHLLAKHAMRDGQRLVMVLADETQWIVTCWLPLRTAGVPGFLDFSPVGEIGLNGCLPLSPGVAATEQGTDGKQRALAVELSGLAPVPTADNQGLDTKVRSVDAVLGAPVNATIRNLPVVNGVLVADWVKRFDEKHAPVIVEDAGVHTTYRFYDAAHHLLRSCVQQ